ncbi:hypothetical protein [Chondromyces apiculatus]|uniref:Uncharacterized protein n=1 Tax=Chondromyces apiculatus DSM 436 TaxID=1192034 RepID=A0A017TCT0_9BACT|nr:hypothetical protein [Chondromyces apiculatus]EYF07073.1 Hypothetical protein CAP_1332 [Chondromyces apiculatus DSM 436]
MVDINAPALAFAAYPTRVDEVLLRLPEEPTVTEEARAYFDARIEEHQARNLGADVGSAAVIEDCLDACNRALPLVLASRLHGYGVLRLRYLLETTRALAVQVAALDVTMVDAAGAGAARGAELRDSRELRRAGLRAFKNLSGRSAEQQARVKKLREEVERPDTRARSLETLALELETLMAVVPEEVVADAGATPDLLLGLRAHARQVLASRERAVNAFGSVRSQYDLMNVLDGRILHELRALTGAMRDARKTDPTVAVLRLSVLRPGKRRAADTPTQPDKAPGTTPEKTSRKRARGAGRDGQDAAAMPSAQAPVKPDVVAAEEAPAAAPAG